ncbi:PREDICTED: uncharacterized protein LOC105453515 isoform X2 [Wasmannia auropunctata]|uniref:uncharacterized protein LOC105453515 isoform X2 n=1 Tax=Wasmannia auropunctata TaxID=64793 RepID=UPI0005EFE9F5|nr:PREDICTED: uncharacterized protein LOC105453515 isoform X2 [Wasmannia auropunctata]
MVRHGQFGRVDGLQCLQLVHLRRQTLRHLRRHASNDDTYDRTTSRSASRYAQFSTTVESIQTIARSKILAYIVQTLRLSRDQLMLTFSCVYVLQSFKEVFSFDLPDFQDTTFFSIQDEYQLLWFAAAINSSDVLLYQLVNNKAELVGTYPQPDGERIIVQNYSAGTLIVVQKKYTDGIVILHLGKNENGTYELQFKQEFEIPEVVHTNIWLEMNRMYLGIASKRKIFIYVWLGENFDKIDTLLYGARKLLPFQSKSFMHVAVVGFEDTRIFRFSVRSNKFVEMQQLHYASDVSSFHFKEGHFEERFLALAGSEYTVLYKEMYGRFVPFQRIAPATRIHSLTMENTVVLLLVKEDIYQYNGWRFLKLPTKLSNLRQIRSIRSHDKDVLVVQDQTGKWKFLMPAWLAKKTWKSLQDETAAWCSEIKQKASQRTLEKLPDLKRPVILNAHIGRLRMQNLNGHNSEELIRLTERYKSTIAKLNLTSSLLAQGIDERLKHAVLHGKKITVKCKTNCHVHRIITDGGINFAKYVESDPNQTQEFAKLKVKTINNWKCPVPNLKIDDIFVKGTINGISMRDLQEGTLKVSGDQVVSGNHIFTNLRVTNVSIPLGIATSNIPKRTLYMKEVKVKDLHLTEDEFLLPLNGPATVMNGSITAARVRLTGLVDISGGLAGKGLEKFKPLREILTPLTLLGDRFLQNVTFRNFVKAKDIVRSRGSSMKEIIENSVPLDSNVSAHLILSSNKTQWSNVILQDFDTTNLVTKNSAETIVISGTKYTNNNVTLSSVAFENLPIPKLTIPLCAEEVIIPDIRTSSIKMGDIIAKNLNVSHVLGAHNLNTTIFDSASALHSIDFSAKLFTGRVFVRNITVSEIKGTNLKDLKIGMNEWIGTKYLEGPVNIPKLVVRNLETPVYLNLSLPTRLKNVIIKGDSDIKRINNIDIRSFMENVLKVDDPISLDHVTFARGFTSSNVHASRSTLNLSLLDTHLNLGSKHISTTLSADAIDVPQTFGYVASDAPSTFIIQGSARFLKEPIVQNIKDVNLKQLSENSWMANEDTILSGSNIYLENITLQGDILINNSNNTLNVKMWTDLRGKLLSKTKDQHISVVSSFKNVEVPNVNAENNSTIQSSDLDLNNLLTNSLMKNTAQTVDAAWHFEELYINNMTWDGKFNGIDLNTDVVRRDVKRNFVTGKKTILGLTTKNLRALNINFSNFTRHALTQRCSKLSIIKGQKIFNNITLNNLSVKGTIMGRNVDNALLKIGNQTLFGIDRIQGQLNAPSLITDGIVNDVNLTELINAQVKKRKAVQTIENKMDFRNGFEVIGNITIGGLYGSVNLTNITGRNDLDIVLDRVTEVMALTEDIATALENRAIYVSKFEAVNEDALQIASNSSNTENVKDMSLNSTCLCELKNVSSICNDTELLNVVAGTNVGAFITKKLVLLDDTAFVVLVSTDFISIYSYVDSEQFDQVAGLYVPDILDASVEPIGHSLWILLRLPGETLILRYHAWNEFDQYVLPGSDPFVISETPNGQHLLIRTDGMWNLGGLFRPEHIFKMPLQGQIETFALGADYYVKATTENGTTVLKARYVGN